MFKVSQKDRLHSILTDIRKRAKEMQKLAELLDDKQIFAYYCSDKDQYQSFCTAYTIELIQRYVRDKDEQQILLASYRLLDGYTSKMGVEARRDLYARNALGNNQLIESTWKTPHESLAKIETKVINELIEVLMEIITDNPKQEGWLGLADEVVAELSERFPNGLPKKLPLPVPDYLPQQLHQRGLSH